MEDVIDQIIRMLESVRQNRDRYYKRIKELEAPLERTCTWKRVNNSYHCWDEYDAWSTSCGKDYAIEEEWDDKIPNYCNNCGGKAQQAMESE